MKILYVLLVFMLAVAPTRASLYGYPEIKKPEISLADAIVITQAMLKTKGHDQKYHIVRAGLLGDEMQTGDGAWTLYLFDADGNEVWAHIQLRQRSCSLNYYPNDYSKNGGGREVYFERDGLKVLGPVKERKSP
jgi:hypothetical protein